MYIIFIRNYKLKLILSICILIIALLSLLFSHFVINNNLSIKVTIDDYISFKHPISFTVNNIFVNESLNEEAVKVNYSFKKTSVKSFSDFSNLKERFSFKYPTSFTLAQKEFTGSDILYHIDFHNQKIGAQGFMQVWNMSYPLNDFLAQSEALSQNSYKDFSTNEIEVNGLPGFIWDYTIKGNNGVYFKGAEVFFKKEEKMYRISYFVSEDKWDKSHSEIYKNIVKSFKTF